MAARFGSRRNADIEIDGRDLRGARYRSIAVASAFERGGCCGRAGATWRPNRRWRRYGGFSFGIGKFTVIFLSPTGRGTGGHGFSQDFRTQSRLYPAIRRIVLVSRIKVALNPIDRFFCQRRFGLHPVGKAPVRSANRGHGERVGLLPSEALLRRLHNFIELNRADPVDGDADQGGIFRRRAVCANFRQTMVRRDFDAPTSAAELVSSVGQEFLRARQRRRQRHRSPMGRQDGVT
jgi:hypothetical protein